MCGRMNFNSKHSQIISEFFGCDFIAPSNDNLSPGQNVATLIQKQDYFQQLDSLWGIQPNWSKRLLINAQSETVHSKATFSSAIKSQRCLIPCSGWYEWRTEEGKKQKYLFSHADDEPLLMAGIWYQGQTVEQKKSPSAELKVSPKQLVTLTTSPNEKCRQYHQRMPVFVLPQYRDFWFNAPTTQLAPLLSAIDESLITVNSA